MESCLISSIESQTCTNGMLDKLFSRHLGFIFNNNTLRIGFSLVDYITENISFYESDNQLSDKLTV